jgi:membrane protease YdiL (CAAX protease family)
MIALFLAGSRFPVGPLRTIKELLLELLGPSLAACRWYDLLLVATVAGFSEELLFRGVLQPLLGLIWSNVLFGLAHAVTVSYAVLAGLIGGYLGWMLSASGNLLAPIIAHALYDFLAFLAVAREWRQSAAGSLQDPP